VIREAVRADLGRVVEVLVRLDGEGTGVDPRHRLRPEAADRLRERIAHDWFGRFLPFPACLLAEDGAGLIAGSVVPDAGILDGGPTACIDALWVAPERRREGLGRALVAAYRARIGAAGFSRIVVRTLARDARALSFWQAMGFDPLHVELVTGSTASKSE
jgi:GNAT superfamily N-acetyltransferase